MDRRFPLLCWLTVLMAAGPPARGEVSLLAERTDLRSLEETRLRVVDDSGADRAWRWRVAALADPVPWLRALPGGQARFTAPWTREPGSFRVVAEVEDNPSIRAEVTLRVGPNPRLARAGGPWDDRPGVGGPALRPYWDTPESPAAFRLAFCDLASASPSLARLDRCWLVAGPGGLRAFTLGGEPVALPGPLETEPGWQCHAVTVLPPGLEPPPDAAPRLAFSESRRTPGAAGDLDARIVTLGADGHRREWPLEGKDGPMAGRRVRDLALDRDGTLFVAFSDHRTVLRMDPAGRISPHAHLPVRRGEDRPAGFEGLALDPDTGRLFLGDGEGLHAVDRSGAVTRALDRGPRAPGHLVVRGRELLITDTRDGDLWALHLDNGRMAAVVAGQAMGSPTRLGPVQGFHPALAEAACAALGDPAPLAFTPEGLGLLATEAGFAALELPSGPLTATALAKAEARVAPPAKPAIPAAARTSRTRSRPGPRGLLRTFLVGLGVLWNPAALAQGPPPPPAAPRWARTALDPMLDQGLDALGNLDAACSEAFLGGARLAPCGSTYLPKVRIQAAAIRQEARRLFVDPSALGAGSCKPGDSEDQAKERIALDQGDIRNDFDALYADGYALQYQLERDGFRLIQAGLELLAARSLVEALVPATEGPATAPAFVLSQASTGLAGAGSGVQAGGSAFGWVAYQSEAHQARYQRWVDTLEPDLLACAKAANRTDGAAPAPAPAPTIPPAPGAAFATALARLGDACALARTRGMTLAVCGPGTLSSIGSSRDNLLDLHASLACLTAGVQEGRQGVCPRTPLSEARLRADTFSLFDEFDGEANAAGYQLYLAGNALLAASTPLALASATAAQRGNATAAFLEAAAFFQLQAQGNGLLAGGADLEAIAYMTKRWRADTTHRFNAVSRAQLDAAGGSATATAAAPPAASSTGPGALTASAGPVSAPATGGAAGTGGAMGTGGALETGAGTGWEPVDASGRDSGAGLWPLGSRPPESAKEPTTSGADRRRPFWHRPPAVRPAPSRDEL